MAYEPKADEPQLSPDQKLDQKLDGLDDNLQPIDKDKKDDNASDKATDDADSTTPVDDDGSDGTADEDGKKDDEGYTIDEGDDELEDTKPKEPDEVKPLDNLNPEQKYIIDKLQPVVVRGTVGEDTKVQEFKVFDPSQLPVGFKYTDDRELSAANKAFTLVETQAERLQTEYRGQETQKSAKEFKTREDNADRQDIGELQRSGDIPKFKVESSSKDFDKDPAAVLVQEVLDFKEDTNKKYYEQYQSGRPYKHIGFEEAFRLYKRENPTDAAQAKEDAERKDIAARTSGATSTESKQKVGVHSGMTSVDLDRLIDDRTSGW